MYIVLNISFMHGRLIARAFICKFVAVCVQSSSDAVDAAKMDMFGVMTREVMIWYPHKVLCKRFNIPDPYPQ